MTEERNDNEIGFSDNTAPSTGHRWLRGIAIIFLTFHAASTLFVLIPSSRLKALIDPVFHHYQAATGTEQHWDMFSSVSNHHTYDVSVEVRRDGGSAESFGPILPGLKEKPDYFRYHTYFTRIDSDRFKKYRAPYAEGVRQALVERGITGRTFEIRKAEQRIRFLSAIRSTGEIAFDGTTLNGPYPLDQPVPNEPTDNE